MDFPEALAWWLSSVAVVSVESPAMLDPIPEKWLNVHDTEPRSWVCGHCGDRVGSNKGWTTVTPHRDQAVHILLCPRCNRPTLFLGDAPIPSALPGGAVAGLPADVLAMYQEARLSAAASASTACMMVCRKILMHVAVERGAVAPPNFRACVEWLFANGWVPPNGKGWVDYVRERGNEANHEIVVMNAKEARAVLTFTEMLLRFVYELPSLLPEPPA